jgi:uncharacterized membrane protein YkgB
VSLGIVFVWFGLLKIFGVSPVEGMIRTIYPSFPYPFTLYALGAVEALIGLNFLLNRAIKATVAVMWLQMAGIFSGLVLAPHLFFQHGNPFLLTSDGEFVIKNLILLAASLVVLTHQES